MCGRRCIRVAGLTAIIIALDLHQQPTSVAMQEAFANSVVPLNGRYARGQGRRGRALRARRTTGRYDSNTSIFGASTSLFPLVTSSGLKRKRRFALNNVGNDVSALSPRHD